MAVPGAVPAGVGKRVLACVVDALAAFLLGGAFVAAGAWEAFLTRDDAEPGGLGLLVGGGAALAVVALGQWIAHGRRGVTLGKALVGLRTVDADTGRPIGMVRALLRALVVGAGTLAAGVGQVVVLASPLFDSGGRRQGWHDKAARALVVDVALGADPVRAQATATARLDGLLAPVAATDVPPRPTGGAVPPVAPPPPPVAPPPPHVSVDDDLPAAPAAGTVPGGGEHRGPDPMAPFPAAVPPVLSAAGGPDDTTDPTAAVDHRGAAPDGAAAGVISAVPGAPGASGGAPGTPARPPLEPTVLVDHVPDALIVSGSSADLDDDVEATRLSLVRRPGGRRRTDGPASAALRLWDGTELTLTGVALVGRNPARRDDEPLPERLVTVPDERRSVSKTHLAVGVDERGTWVRDRGSTNGTVVTLPDGSQVICASGQQVRVPVGATVSFGDYWFTVA